MSMGGELQWVSGNLYGTLVTYRRFKMPNEYRHPLTRADGTTIELVANFSYDFRLTGDYPGHFWHYAVATYPEGHPDKAPDGHRTVYSHGNLMAVVRPHEVIKSILLLREALKVP